MFSMFARTVDHPSPAPHRSAPRLVPALTPAGYLRLRREAAGIGIRDVARAIAAKPGDIPIAERLVCQLEKPGVVAKHGHTLAALRRAFPFDPAVYRQLACEPADRHPRVCRGCGCSHWDPCDDGQGTCCAWESDTQCTRCAGTCPAGAELRS